MFGLTKLALKRPVTVILALITILYIGLQAIFGAKLELMPEMNFPMMVVSTTYIGVSPTDIDKLVTKPVEEGVSTLSGIKTVQGQSMENSSMVIVRYNYGTNMDKAYMDLKKQIDMIKSDLPKDANEPVIIQIDISGGSDIDLVVSKSSEANLYGYVTKNIVPEFEKNSTVSRVSVSGGQENYLRIQVLPEKLEQYNLDLNTIVELVKASNFNIPAGKVEYGSQDLNLSIGADYKDIEKIKNIIIPLKTGDVIKLSDIAKIDDVLAEKTSLSRYNSEDVVSISISKQQSASAVSLSRQVKSTINTLTNQNSDLEVRIINDNADSILSAIKSVFQTLILAVILSMIVLFIFFGDIKASLIVGSSIPVSVMLALTMMRATGFSFNMISLGSLVLGVGMIVDASIVVLDSCFKEKAGKSFLEAALEGTGVVIASILGSTITTCVVFVPLALLKGLSGQMFTQLGWTIVFCMVASLFSAITIVPLLFVYTKPIEKEKTISHKMLAYLQDKYREVATDIIPRRIFVISSSIFLLVISLVMAANIGMELSPDIDNGQISINMEVAPGLKIDKVDSLVKKVERVIVDENDLDRYSMTYGASGSIYDSNSGVNINAYLRDDRKLSTKEIVAKWKEELDKISDASISVRSVSGASFSSGNSDVNIPLQGTDYDMLKKASDELVKELQNEPYLKRVHSDAENGAPLISIDVDPVKAGSYGIAPASVGARVNTLLRGSEVMRYTKDGTEIVVKLEVPKDKYKTISNIEDIILDTPTGSKISVGDIANISFKDSATSIMSADKQYQISITADAAKGYEDSAALKTQKFIDAKKLPSGVSRTTNALDDAMAEEMKNLMNALITAIFLVFIVMAMQFESPRFSFMVMFTIPFALIGAFGLLFLFDVKISMNSMLGFLMMVGTVVNNGILYVDTVNQLKEKMELRKALVEAGVLRLRPILMTTLTTVLSMIPMALAIGKNGEALQGLALVNVGGLMASTILSLVLLPTLYEMLDKKRKKSL